MEILNGCAPIIDTGELNFILTLTGKARGKGQEPHEKEQSFTIEIRQGSWSSAVHSVDRYLIVFWYSKVKFWHFCAVKCSSLFGNWSP
jgi:hypothetical protein